jgi:hypothetical protein
MGRRWKPGWSYHALAPKRAQKNLEIFLYIAFEL